MQRPCLRVNLPMPHYLGGQAISTSSLHRGPEMTNPNTAGQQPQPHFAPLDCIGRAVVLNLPRPSTQTSKLEDAAAPTGKRMAAAAAHSRNGSQSKTSSLSVSAASLLDSRSPRHHLQNQCSPVLVYLECSWPCRSSCRHGQSYRRNVVSLFCEFQTRRHRPPERAPSRRG